MKGLSLTAPWPHLIAAEGVQPGIGKRHETRGPRQWIGYRGPLAIHAALNLKPVDGASGLYRLCRTEPFSTAIDAYRDWRGIRGALDGTLDEALPRGCIVAIADVVECYQVGLRGKRMFARGKHGVSFPLPEGNDRQFGDYSPYRHIYELANIRPLRQPVPCRGAQGLWVVPADVRAQIDAQLLQAA